MSLSPLVSPVDLSLWEARLPSGLTVRVDHRPERRSGYCALGVDFGSVDRGQVGLPVPAGTAHFLEHELFEDELGDVSDRFAAVGASANAFTGFSGTTYVASTTPEMEEAIALLLRFVQGPVFDDARVSRERQVIAQEIRMYADDPDWRLFEGLMECLFVRHPVREPIAGSEASIADIDAALLEAIHRRHYHPQALCLAVSGPIDPERVLELAEEDQAGRPTPATPRLFRPDVDEPTTRARARFEADMPIGRPRLMIGIKETVVGGSPDEVARRQLATRMALDSVLGRSSPTFQALYEEGLIDESFGVSHSAERDFGFTTLGGETDDPERLDERLRQALTRAVRDGLDPAAHARVHHKVFGSLMRALDSTESVAMGLIGSRFRGVSPFSVARLVSEIGLDEVHARLAEHVRDDAMAVAVARVATT